MRRKVGISTVNLQKKYGDFEALEKAKAIGADAVDFDLIDQDFRHGGSRYAADDTAIRTHYETVGARARELGIEICQTHGRIQGFRNRPDEDDALVENGRRDLLATASLGAPVCVMHTTTTMYMGADAAPELMHRLNFDQFTRLLPFAEEYGVRLATETFGDVHGVNCCDFFGNIREFLIGYNRVKAASPYGDRFTVCVDTGHSHKATRFNGNPSAGDVIRLCGGNIAALHLNDNDTFTDQHKIPLTGSIDWDDVFDALDEIGYTGVYNMEVNLTHFGEEMMEEEAAFAVKVMRAFLNRRYGADA